MVLYDSDIERLVQVKEYVTSNLKMDLKADVIAQKFHIDKYKLWRQFQFYYKIPIGQYIHQQRMQKALELLKHKKMPVSEVAVEVGYHDRSGFTHAFTAYFKMSPQLILRS